MDSINSLDISYLPVDPRLISAGHSGQRLVLCEPTLSGKICLDDVKTGFYGNYSDIRAGNIIYYKDYDLMKPFISYGGVFPPTTSVQYEDFVDSNGVRKPHYRRLLSPGEIDERCITGRSEPIQPGCLTFVRDTNRVRADLLASNIWRRNQENGFALARN